METPETIHRFWFGNHEDDPDDAEIGKRQAKLWWAKHAEVDAEIRQRFAGLIDAASKGALDDWASAPDGVLALILLTDQFPRNAWRETPRAFASDEAARRFCCLGIAQGFDRLLRPVERVFHYLPLEHSELLPDQDRAVALFESLARAVPEHQVEAFEGYLDFARRHREVIARFGRFPHRNVALERPSTEEELQFLSQPGSRF